MSTSTDVENDTWGWPSTPAPSAEGAAAELHDDSRGTAAKAAEAPDQLEEIAAFHVGHALSLDGEGTAPAAVQPALGTVPHFDIAAMVTHAPRAQPAVRRASHLLDMRSAQALPYS